MMRGEQLYRFEKNQFTDDEIEYIKNRSHEMADDSKFVASINLSEDDEAQNISIGMDFTEASTYREAGEIIDEELQSLHDTIELVSLRDRFVRALEGVRLYSVPEDDDVLGGGGERKAENIKNYMYNGGISFYLFDEEYTTDEVDYIWSCIQRRVEHIAPYTRLSAYRDSSYTSLRIGIESPLKNLDDNFDKLQQIILSSVGDDELRKRLRDSDTSIFASRGRFREDEFGYGVGNFDEYLESLKTEK